MMHDPPYNYTIEHIAALTGKSRWIVSQTMALTQQPEEIQNWIISGELTTSQVQFLSRIPDRAQRVAFAKRALQHEWSVRKLDRYTKPFVANDKPASAEADAVETAETAGADAAPKTPQQKSSAGAGGAETAASGGPAKVSRNEVSAPRSAAGAIPTSASDLVSKVLQHATEKVLKGAKKNLASASVPQVFPWWALGVLALGMIAYYVGERVSSPILSLVLLAINGMLVIVGAAKLLGYARATHRRWIPALADLVSSPRKLLEWPRVLRQRASSWIAGRRQKHAAAPAKQSRAVAAEASPSPQQARAVAAEVSPSPQQLREEAATGASSSLEQSRAVAAEASPSPEHVRAVAAEVSPSPQQLREEAPTGVSSSPEQSRDVASAEASPSPEQARAVLTAESHASPQLREMAPAENAPSASLIEGRTLEESLREIFPPSPTKDDGQGGPKSS